MVCTLQAVNASSGGRAGRTGRAKQKESGPVAIPEIPPKKAGQTVRRFTGGTDGYPQPDGTSGLVSRAAYGKAQKNKYNRPV